MVCPNCGAETHDEAAAFCSRCGAGLDRSEAEVTETIEAPSDATERVEAPTKDIPSPGRWPGFGRSGRELVAAAGFAFLTLVSCGAVLALAGKLQYPQLGASSDSLSALTAIVIAGLAVLGASIHIGDLTLSATPLGALAIVGAAGAVATARMVRRRDPAPVDVVTAMRRGIVVAVPFALMCWLAALVYRIREDPTPVSADGTSVLFLALLWGAVFGVAGGLWAGGPRAAVERWFDALGDRGRWVRDGIRDAAWVLAIAGVLGLTFLLLWIIGALLGGGPEAGLGFSGLVAALIYLLAFGPNLVVSVITLALGAPVEIGAGLTQRGRLIGSLEDHSLFAWGGDGTVPWWVYLLLVIPVAATLIAGWNSARQSTTKVFPHRRVLVCAAIVGLVLFELAGLSDARLGAGLVRNKGVALAAPRAWTVGLLAIVWTAAGVTAGWFVYARARRDAGDGSGGD